MSALIILTTHGHEGINVLILVLICFDLKLKCLDMFEALEKDVEIDSLYFLGDQELVKFLDSYVWKVVSACY